MLGKRFCTLILAGASAAVVGCSHDTDGELVTPTVVAGLRYVNLVPDTIGLDFRVIDIVGDAPNTFNATFRTGGQPYGVAITGLPPHTSVLAGTRQIRVFLSSSNPAIASQIMLDQTFTFEANQNYTMYLWGYANGANGTPGLAALMVKDSVPTVDTASVAYRVIHLGGSLAPTLAATAVNVYLDTNAAATAPVNAASTNFYAAFTNVLPGEVRPYQLLRRRLAVGAVPALNYRAVVAANAAPTVVGFEADVPNGDTATATDNPVAGDRISGSAITAIIVPRSVAGTGATAFTTPNILFAIDQRPARTLP